MSTPKLICPRCYQEAGVEIVYGEVDPGSEVQQMAVRGEIVMHGCMVLAENMELSD